MKTSENGIKSFSKNYWTVIFMEFMERGSYYGVMSIFAIYLTLTQGEGGLGLGKEQAGNILSIVTPLVYFVPIIAGVIADRYGYKLCLSIAFVIMALGYFLSGIASDYILMLTSMSVMAIGAGTFKPIVSGTIAIETTPSNRSLGFGIFYWSINLGSFIFPLIFVPILKEISYELVFFMAAICTGSMVLVSSLILKEPVRVKSNKKILEVLVNTFSILKDYKFFLIIVVYSGFWVMYFQMFGSVLWYLQDYINTTPIDNAVNSLLGVFVDNPSWKFDVEHVTVMNAFTIIVLQLVISGIVKNLKALPTMLIGILIGTAGMAMLAVSQNVWVFLAGLVIFSIGEMTAQPKYIAYVGTIAPEDKKAQYMGFSFLNNVIASAIAYQIGPRLYVKYVDELNKPDTLWLIFASIGLATAVGLFLLNKYVIKSKD